MKALNESIFDQAIGNLPYTHLTTLRIALSISPLSEDSEVLNLQHWANGLNWFQYFYC